MRESPASGWLVRSPCIDHTTSTAYPRTAAPSRALSESRALLCLSSCFFFSSEFRGGTIGSALSLIFYQQPALPWLSNQKFKSMIKSTVTFPLARVAWGAGGRVARRRATDRRPTAQLAQLVGARAQAGERARQQKGTKGKELKGTTTAATAVICSYNSTIKLQETRLRLTPRPARQKPETRPAAADLTAHNRTL